MLLEELSEVLGEVWLLFRELFEFCFDWCKLVHDVFIVLYCEVRLVQLNVEMVLENVGAGPEVVVFDCEEEYF